MDNVNHSSPKPYEETLLEKHNRILAFTATEEDRPSHISRIPAELLQMVLENFILASPDESKLENALLLSRICRRWRQTAVNTPSLWSTIDLDVYHGVEFRNLLLLELAKTRIKSVPPSVTIRGIALDHATENFFESWPIFALPRLLELKLKFQRIRALNFFLRSSLKGIRHVGLRELHLVGSKGTFDYLEAPSNISSIKAFPSLTHLSLVDMDQLAVSGVLSETLISLNMRSISCVDLERVLGAFPNLERLQVHSVGVIDSSGKLPRTMPNMRHLRVAQVSFFQNNCVSVLHCPKLVSIYHTHASSNELIDFIRQNPTIERLECFLNDRTAVACAAVAPRLTRVHLAGSTRFLIHWREAGLDSPPFPNLKVLILRYDTQPLSRVEFEDLVRARFLSPSHPESRLEDPKLHVEQLNINLRGCVKWEKEEWAKHPLCVEAIKRVYAEEVGWFIVSLRWL